MARAAEGAALVAGGMVLGKALEMALEAWRQRQEPAAPRSRRRKSRKKRQQRQEAGEPSQRAQSDEDGEPAEDGRPDGGSVEACEEPRDCVRLQQEPLSLDEIARSVQSPRAGAVVTFSGTTRNSFEGKAVVSLAYEAYESMALRELRALCAAVRAEWPELLHITIVHKLGDCPVGETSVVIAVSSPHRAPALAAARFAIDELKAKVPIWKKEVYREGEPAWKENGEFYKAAPTPTHVDSPAQSQ